MQDNWQKRWGRQPTPEELDGLIQQFIRETVLYREALAMGLNRHDTVIRRHLARKMEFLANDLVSLAPPTDADLQAYFNEHRERYREPARYTFTQVFFDPDKRGDATLDDAKQIKAALITGGGDTGDTSALGDGLMQQNYYPEKSQVDIQKQFGGGFADSVAALSPGQWHGPVLSGYGVHLVFVHSVSEPPPAVLDEVREPVVRDWQNDRRETMNDAFYVKLRDRYTIVIEDVEPQPEKVAAAQEPAR